MIKEEIKDITSTVISAPTEDNAEDITKRLVAPHKGVSRDVTNDDIDRVMIDAQIMMDILYTPVGIYSQGVGLAHPQIDDKDPLRFFVLSNGMIIINPEIVNKTNSPVDSTEACLTFPNNTPINVPRSHKITLKYQTVKMEEVDGKNKFVLTDFKTDPVSGNMAKICQHEIDHLFGKYIYKF